MKQILIIIALTFLSITTSAQNIQGSYRPKADGQVKKQQVEFQNVEDTGQDVVWDFSRMELPNNKYTVKYALAETGNCDGIVTRTELGTRFYYDSTMDSIMLCGYENNLSKVQYDRPELLLHMPLVYGNRHEGLFHGIESYCEKIFMRVCGSYMVEVDGTGSMLLPSGDTLRNVSRVHIRKLTSQQYFPFIMTERELKVYVDSITPYTSDSIYQHMLTDTLLTETNTYRWYATGYRYPIMECTAIGHQNAQPYYTTACYCSPEEQELTSDEENEWLRQLLADADNNGGSGNNRGNGDDSKKNNGSDGKSTSPLQNTNIAINGMNINVNYYLTIDATVNVLVCDIAGMVYRHGSQSGKAGQSQQLNINYSGLHRGQYVLYLNVNGQVTSQTISL